MKLLWSAFIALNVWLYRVSGGRMMGKTGNGRGSARRAAGASRGRPWGGVAWQTHGRPRLDRRGAIGGLAFLDGC
jgi:hypothetical protein